MKNSDDTGCNLVTNKVNINLNVFCVLVFQDDVYDAYIIIVENYGLVRGIVEFSLEITYPTCPSNDICNSFVFRLGT